jgi:serine/threonine-protein kinase RsbW
VTGAHPVLHLGSFGSASSVRSTRRSTRTFRGTPASVPEARRFVAELLAGCPAREVLMTCVSELCANAIAHSDSGNGGVFIVEVDLPRPGVARIAVTDEGGPSLPVAGRLDLMAEGGRGLAMVAACTNRWGYADAHPGRTVWAEACWPVLVPSPGQDAPRMPARRPRLRFPRSSPLPPGESRLGELPPGEPLPGEPLPGEPLPGELPPGELPPDDWPAGPAA